MYTEHAVSFHDNTLISIEIDGVVYVAMKPIVEGMGLDWKSQHRKLMSQKDKFNCGHLTIVAADGKSREMLCIPLGKLNGWLFSVNPEKVRPEIREIVILYQEECFAVLYQYWHKGVVVNPRFQATIPDMPPADLTLKEWLALIAEKRRLSVAIEKVPPSARAILQISLNQIRKRLGEPISDISVSDKA